MFRGMGMPDRKTLAYHEAGHVIAAFIEHKRQNLGGQPLKSAWIVQNESEMEEIGDYGKTIVGSWLGKYAICKTIKYENPDAMINYYLAGMAVEHIKFGRSLSDLRNTHTKKVEGEWRGDWPMACEALVGWIKDYDKREKYIKEHWSKVVKELCKYQPEVANVARYLCNHGKIDNLMALTLLEESSLIWRCHPVNGCIKLS